MFRNYLIVAWRNLKKQRLYSVINVLGLSVGLSAFLLIALYLNNELSYDRMHPDYEEIYRLSYNRKWDNGNTQAMATSSAVWAPRYEEQFPEVSAYTRLTHQGYPGFVNKEDDINSFMEPKFYWVDANFLEVFNFPLIYGNKETVFSQTDGVVLSESMVNKYFGEENPMGEIIEFSQNFGTIKLTVTGVMEDPPQNSHLKPTFIANVDAYLQKTEQAWNWNPFQYPGDAFVFTYLKIDQESGIEKIEDDFPGYIKSILENNQNENYEEYESAKLTPIADLHFHPEMKWELEAPADSDYIPIFTITALLVLIIACINFMNLATARSAKRSREVGLRKTLGSTKQQLITQFYGESFLITFLSAVIALGLAIACLPYFNSLTGKAFVHTDILAFETLTIAALLAIFVGLFAGSYPAIYLSSFKPIAALRGIFTSGRSAETIRRGLVIFQFAISVILIICTLVVADQMNLINGRKLGEEKDRILSIRLGGFGLGDDWITIRDQLENNSFVEEIAVANHLPRLPHFGMINRNFRFPERDMEELEWNKFDVDFNFASTFNLEFLAGRNFNRDIRSDSNAVILNEAAVRNLQLSPDEVIGLTIRDRVWNNQLQQQVDLDGKVIGVVKDFPYKSVNTMIEPLTIWGTPSPWDKIMYLKLTPGNYTDKVAEIRTVWQQVSPGMPMENWFLDFEFGRLYENERKMMNLFILFSGLTIFIAMLGLFALTSYVTEQRRKEISLRKVLGASERSVMWLLVFHFLKLVGIAFVLGLPIAWWSMDQWLDSFVYRVDIRLAIILIAGLSVSVVTLLTVGIDTYKTAVSNPVKSLRTE